VVPLLTEFSGTFMLVGPIQAPLFYVSSTQIDVQIPVELTPNRQYYAVVTANGVPSPPEMITLVPFQPGMASFAGGTGVPQVVAQHAVDYSLVTAASPAKPGEPLIIYLAGLGATNPQVPSGTPTPSELVPAVVQPTITLNGEIAAIAYAGLSPSGIGLYQINFTVPSDAQSGNLTLVVTQPGTPSMVANTTSLPVSH
jgi:uncharacterized protein (TIGR03437 family)